MTYRVKYLLALVFILSAALYAQNVDKGQTTGKNTNAATQTNVQPDETEKIFETHCARCHMPPMALSQRTTGTIVMHMRMRARLSRRDEQMLLKYLAP